MQDILYTLIIYPIEGFLGFIYQQLLRFFWIDGLAIVFLSIIMTVVTLPLYNMAESWQNAERDIQKRMKKKLDDIKKVFKGSELHMIIRTYYRQNNYHPIYSLRSVLGLAIQVPFFIAAYHYLNNLESIKGASYYFIKDLSKADSLVSIGGITINILPIAMTLINLASAAVYSKKLNMREQIQLFVMAILFLFLLYNSPAGLVLYWTTNNVCSLIKNIVYTSSKPRIWLRRITYSLVSIIFIYTFLLRIPFFKELASLQEIGMRSNKIIQRNVISSVILLIIILMPIITRYLKRRFYNTRRINMLDSKNRDVIFFLSCAGLFVLTGLVIPSSLISSSPVEFTKTFDGLFNPLTLLKQVSLQSFSMFIVIPFSLYYLFKEKVKTRLTLIFFGLLLVSVVHVNIFSGNYGMISSYFKFDSPEKLIQGLSVTIINILTIIMIVVVFNLLIYKKYFKIIYSFITIIIISLIALFLLNTVKTIYSYNDYLAQLKKNTVNDRHVKIEPVYKFSKSKENVLIIMLDRAVSSYFGEMMEYEPEIAKSFSGFVWYPNTLSFNVSTLIASPPLFGGYEYTPLEMNRRVNKPLVEKHNESLLLMPMIFKKAGYNCIFTDPSYANYQWIPDISIFKKHGIKSDLLVGGKYSDLWMEKWRAQNKIHNYAADDYSESDYQEFIRQNFIRFSIFRMMPVFLRNYVYDEGFWHNVNFKANFSKFMPKGVVRNYAVLEFLPELTEYDSKNKEFILMVNELTHQDYILYGPDYIPGHKKSDSYKKDYKFNFDFKPTNDVFGMNVAAYKKIAEWFEHLKREGVYDNTKIIIVSDHGWPIETPVFREKMKYRAHFNPVLLVKDFHKTGEVKKSMEFMTNADVPAIAVSHLGEVSNPFTEKVITPYNKKDGVKIITTLKWRVEDHGKFKFVYKPDELFLVKDNLFVEDNWIISE